MEENKLGQHFWNFLTKPKSEASYEETEVEGVHNDFEAYNEETNYEVEDVIDFEGMAADEEAAIRKDCQNNEVTEADYSFIEVPQGIAEYSYTTHTYNMVHGDQSLPVDSTRYTEDHPGQVYDRFKKATRAGKWSDMKEFLKFHPEALSLPLFSGERTALHYSLCLGKDREKIAECLVERMEEEDLEVIDSEGHTPLALAAVHHSPLWLLKCMVNKNRNLPNIGRPGKVPVVVASWKGFPDTTEYLYECTHKNILSHEHDKGEVGVHLLRNCITINLFGIASQLVETSPKILELCFGDEYPMHTFSRTFSALSVGELEESDTAVDGKKSVALAREFLRLVCEHLSNVDVNKLKECVGDAMIEAAKHGNIEFITEMLKVDRELIMFEKNGKDIFWLAIENRREQVFNLIYPVGDDKDSITSHPNPELNNIVHWGAILPHSSILDRILSPALQMQTELQWFKAVAGAAKARYQGNVNRDGDTPRQLFTKQHKNLLKEAETSMKETAKAASTVGALIITTMFAAAFVDVTAATSNSSFTSEVLFNIFVVCDALSLCSSTTAILVFLEILTSSYSEDDFLLRLPRKFMAGFCTLIVAIGTMMTAFCSALAISLEHRPLLIIVPFLVFVFVPVMFYKSSIFPLLVTTYRSTYGPSIFDKTTQLPDSKRGNIGCCYSED